MSKRLAAPDITVVIPTFNRAEDLRRCLTSLVAQTFDNFEVLVCDDGSTDNSAEVAREFVERLDVEFETAANFGGPARPRNRGVSRARAAYIAFLDSDDWWAPTKLELSMSALAAGADLVYHDLYIVRSPDQAQFDDRIVSTKPRHPMFVELMCTGMSIPNSSVVVRKDLLDRIGGVSEERALISVEDYDTWIRLAQFTENFVRIPDVLGYYWMGGGNISAASKRQTERIKYLYSRHIFHLRRFERRSAEGFLSYRVARISHLCGELSTARMSYFDAIKSPIRWVYRFKAILFLSKCYLVRGVT